MSAEPLPPDAPADAPRDAIASAFDDCASPAVERAANPTFQRRTLGSFELESVLGEGGFGVVFLAHQHGALDRVVALKVLRTPLMGAETTRRFEIERQVLARLEHPGIATIHEAGVSELGQPYFAMEYVAGPQLTTYCEAHAASLRTRLQLFMAVCAAVHHAHERGVVHRDLKPANILVATVDGQPHPKVIDFGIAKLSQDQDEVLTLRTQTGQVLGTPEYMSPEQADGSVRVLDGRSDVYALGVILYELLTGTLPLLEREAGGLSMHDLLRTIRDVEPQRPSTRLIKRTRRPSSRHARSSGALVPANKVRGDLDWVCLKALEKDPDRRYTTAQELAADLARYVEDRPVLARPPSLTHLAAKFVRRHRGLVVAAGLLFASLVAGIAATTYSLQRAIQHGDAARADRARFDGRRLAAESQLASADDPTRAILLGLEAAQLIESAAVNNALLAAMSKWTEESVLEGHQRMAWGKGVFLRDGTLLLTATDDPMIRLWDTATGSLLRCIGRGDALLADIAAAPDGRCVATAAQDGRVVVWDLDTGSSVFELPRREQAATQVKYDPSGTTLAVAYATGPVRTFDAATGAERQTYGPLPRPCSELEFSATGTYLAVSEADVLHIFRVEDGDETTRFAPAETALAPRIRSILSHPTEDLFALRLERRRSNEWGALLLSAEGEVLATEADLRPLSFSPDGRWLIGSIDAGDERLALGRLHVQTRTLQRSAQSHAGIRILPLGDDLALWTTAEQTILSSTASPSATAELNGHRYATLGAAWDPATRRIATWSRDRSVRLWQVDAPTRPFLLPLADVGAVHALGRSNEGVRVLFTSASEPPVVRVYNVDRGVVELELPDVRAQKSQLARNGSRVVAVPRRASAGSVDDEQHEVISIDLTTGTTQRFDLGASISDFCVSDDGSACVFQAGVEKEEVRTLDLNTGAQVTVAARTQPTHLHATMNPSAGLLVVRVDHQVSALVRASDGETLKTLGGHGGDHWAYALSADGRRLLSTGVAGMALVRDLESGSTLAEYRGLEGVNDHAGFARGETLAWSQSGEAIHLFVAGTGEAFARLTPHDGRFCNPVESGDGRFLLTVTTTGWFQRWPLDPVAYARRIAPRELEPEELERFQIGDDAARLARMEAHARAIGTGTRLQRVARIHRQKGDIERASQLLAEAVATGTCDEGVWLDHFVALCEQAQALSDPVRRAALLEQATAALQRVGELGLPPSRAAAEIAPGLLAEHAALQALASE
ncbi:MAG: serine/threonine-protein kinase [Planctomycetota bacterium]